jgi:hypothetical protein
LKRICERALAPRSADRYPTAAAMRAELEQYLAALVQKPKARDLGGLVSQAFAEERARIASLVEEQMRVLRATTTAEASGPIEVPRINQVMPSLTPHAATPSSKSAPLSGHMAAARSMAQPQETGYPVRWLVLGGIALVLIGAAATTAIMQPWAQGSGGNPPPAASTPDAH